LFEFWIILKDPTIQTIVLGTSLLGAVSGAVGSFAMLRKRALVGDAVAHAALPGICIAFLVMRDVSLAVLMLGAAISGALSMVVMSLVTSLSRIKEDSSLGIVLSVFFGFGILLLTHIQKIPGAGGAGLDRYLFGQAAALLKQDVFFLSAIALGLTVVMLVYWKELKLFSFDPEFAMNLGYKRSLLELLFTVLLVSVIVIGLQSVGVVLVSAMLVAPAAAARQWVRSLKGMVFLSAGFGVAGSFVGALVSASMRKVPTGPVVVLVLGCITVVSLAFAPGRGVYWSYRNTKAAKRKFLWQRVLIDLYEMESQHVQRTTAHTVPALQAMSYLQSDLRSSMKDLQRKQYVRVSTDGLRLTDVGARAARDLIGELVQA
jgi:manganese/zinc/iron transport system permease protein